MGLLIIRHKVTDYSKWRPQFKVTSPRHVRFTPNNGRWAAHPSQHFGCAFMSTRPRGRVLINRDW